MVDVGILGDIGGAISGFNTNVGSGLVTAIIVLQIPLILMFGLLSLTVAILLWGDKMRLVLPWEYKWHITNIKPFIGNRFGIIQDDGATTIDHGKDRFKLKKENVIMQLPSTTNAYPNNEIMIVSLSKFKKVNAKRAGANYADYTLNIDIEDPSVADGFFYDQVEERDPNMFYKRINQMWLLWLFWFYSGLVLTASNFLIIYPIMLKYLFGGG